MIQNSKNLKIGSKVVRHKWKMILITNFQVIC